MLSRNGLKLRLFVYLFFLSALGASQCNGEQHNDMKFLSPDGKNYLIYENVKDKKVKFSVYNCKIDMTVEIAEVFIRYPITDSILWHNNDLLEINVKTGSPGNYSFFYSVEKNTKSGKHYFPLAVDPKRHFVLVAQDNVYIMKIFTPSSRFIINEEFEETAIKWLIFDRSSTFFGNNGDLIYRYKSAEKKWLNKRLKSHEISRAINN